MNINITVSPSLLTFCLRGDFTRGSVSNIHQYIDWNNALKSRRNPGSFPLSVDSAWKIETILLLLIHGKLHLALGFFNQPALKTSDIESVQLMIIC